MRIDRFVNNQVEHSLVVLAEKVKEYSLSADAYECDYYRKD